MKTYTNKTVKVGTILYSSWGYDQTNIDYYMITKIVGKTFVEIQHIESKLDESKSTAYCDAVIPYKVLNPAARTMRKKVRVDSYGDVSLRLNTYSNAWLWDGQPKMQTNAYYGR
tara:strand:+ start:1576 stop:1917 length:342 start_codon:yes stop_codon:yes gene_type:complete